MSSVVELVNVFSHKIASPLVVAYRYDTFFLGTRKNKPLSVRRTKRIRSTTNTSTGTKSIQVHTHQHCPSTTPNEHETSGPKKLDLSVGAALSGITVHHLAIYCTTVDYSIVLLHWLSTRPDRTLVHCRRSHMRLPAAAPAWFVPSLSRGGGVGVVGGGGVGNVQPWRPPQRFSKITAATTTTTNFRGGRLFQRATPNPPHWFSTMTAAAARSRRTATTTITGSNDNDNNSGSDNNNNNSDDNNNNNHDNPNELVASFPRPTYGRNVGMAMQALVDCDCVCFDVDSTVIREEGIDVLAVHLGKGEQVAALTLSAMEGGMPFQDALQARLDLLQPSRLQILNCLQQHPFRLTENIRELVQTLHQQNKHVYLVSGGFRIMIEPVAAQLLIHRSNIVANQILFDDNDTYVGFDKDEPTSRDMGKPRALEQIQTMGHYTTMVMIGDGATDAQAKPPAQAFIGFGGVVVRETVRQTADWFVTDFADLLHILSHKQN